MGMASGNSGFGYKFKLPSGARPTNDQMEKHLAITIKAWAEKRWHSFGQDMGLLLQEMALTVFAQKYTVDSFGMLQKNMEWQATPAQSPMLTYMVLSAGAAAALGLVVTRRV